MDMSYIAKLQNTDYEIGNLGRKWTKTEYCVNMTVTTS